jgi:hypothetical protein
MEVVPTLPAKREPSPEKEVIPVEPPKRGRPRRSKEEEKEEVPVPPPRREQAERIRVRKMRKRKVVPVPSKPRGRSRGKEDTRRGDGGHPRTKGQKQGKAPQEIRGGEER